MHRCVAVFRMKYKYVKRDRILSAERVETSAIESSASGAGPLKVRLAVTLLSVIIHDAYYLCVQLVTTISVCIVVILC